MKMSSLRVYLRHPVRLLVRLGKDSFLKKMPDELYLRMVFKDAVGYTLDLEKPKTFNEKLQWLKLYDRKPEYTRMVDKYEAKKYVAERIGEEYVIPTLGVWDSFDEIDFDKLPEQFVLKCTHDSGGLVIAGHNYRAHFAELKTFIDWILDDKDCSHITSSRSVRNSLRIALAETKSLRTGETVKL